MKRKLRDADGDGAGLGGVSINCLFSMLFTCNLGFTAKSETFTLKASKKNEGKVKHFSIYGTETTFVCSGRGLQIDRSSDYLVILQAVTQ